jgi:hypothetical protein
MRDKILMVFGLMASVTTSLRAQWAAEFFLGGAASAPSPLTIRQAGEPALRFTARYATRPMAWAPYYAFRISRWWPSGWGVFADNLHHKLYLTNPPPEVQRFEVTYGYNFLALGPAWRSGEWSLLAGAGPVLTNPTSTVRGLAKSHRGGFFGLGYYVDGAHLQLGVNRRFHVARWAFISADLRASAAWARVDVAEGSADVPNYAIHFLLGVGAGNKRETRNEKRETE